MLFYILTIILYTAILHKLITKRNNKMLYPGNHTIERYLLCDEPVCIL